MRRRTTAGTILVAILALTACGANDDSGGDASDSAAGAIEPAAPGQAGGDAVAEGPAVDSPADGDGGGTAPDESADKGGGLLTQAVQTAANRHVISTVELTVETDDVTEAAGRAASVASAAGGFVASEHTSGQRSATLTLKIPSPRLDRAIADLERLGKVTDRSRQADDVTRQVIDVASRVESQRASIARIRTLLAEADRLADIISIESELARREADLDALLSQQEELAGLTSLATVNVSLQRESEPADDDDDDGFLAGLASGWDAFVTATVTALTVVGALLPFAVLAALVGVPAYVLIRRRRARGAPAADVGAQAPSA